MQDMTLGWRQLEFRRERRQVCSLSEKEFHQKLPRLACDGFGWFHKSIRFRPSIVDMVNYMHMVGPMTRHRLISLDDTVVFPGMPVTLALDAGSDKHIFLMPRHGNEYVKIGVVAEVTERVQLPGRGFALSLMGLHRGVPGAAQTGSDGYLRVNVEERPDIIPPASVTRELEREYRAVLGEILELRGDD